MSGGCMGEYMLWVWLGVICLGLIIEAAEAGTLVSIWFSAGAVIPLFMSFWKTNDPVYISLQFIFFGVITILLLVFIRKLAKKWLFKNSNEKTNLDTYVGKKYVVKEIIEGNAYIKINGVGYAVQDEDDELKVGDTVEIVEFKGNKTVVNKVKEKTKDKE